MSRRHRLCTDINFIHEVLHSAEIIFMSFNRNNEAPYIIPFNFVFVESKNCIYVHTGLEGTKQDLIKINNNVGFSTVSYSEVCPEKTTSYYSSVCGIATAKIIYDNDEKIFAFDLFDEKYNAACKLHKREVDLNRCMIIRFDISSLCGKRHLKDMPDMPGIKNM